MWKLNRSDALFVIVLLPLIVSIPSHHLIRNRSFASTVVTPKDSIRSKWNFAFEQVLPSTPVSLHLQLKEYSALF